ncbi:hypothetical protein BC939DRAFT_465046 [Gamsiella multidivaricata]|uniref:uncharacterized protein n=1 Tax=Gamsiella multidivaricata TaxID=101098 RepID=UPI002220ECF7|nr:uncharacterized protein BC939DRAFT_465046 [Gamsiella multidivaricata]KAI7817704.1 hypothetical protein BC939DRAFT_465046 [Gamsiella multidivaricata]
MAVPCLKEYSARWAGIREDKGAGRFPVAVLCSRRKDRRTTTAREEIGRAGAGEKMGEWERRGGER